MNFQPVILISDVLFFLLLALAAAGLFYASRRAHLRRAWISVLADPAAMVALAVLLLFITATALDSLHFRRALEKTTPDAQTFYAVDVESLLDISMNGVRERREKSYSAPFAHTLFERQTIDLGNGRRMRDFPRLTYGSAHLKNPVDEKAADIALRGSQGLLIAMLLWAALALAISAATTQGTPQSLYDGLKRLWHGDTPLAWRAFLTSAGLLLVILVPLFWLNTHYHVFGTDRTGNDVFHYAFKAMRTAVLIGTLASLVTLPLGIGFGLLAGYVGGWVDDAIQFVYTVISSIPYVLLIAASVLTMQVVIESHSEWFDTAASRSDVRLVALCLIIGAISWTSLCRLVRAETLKLRELDYVQAARAFGVTPLSIMRRHILPNAFHIVLITLVLDFSGLVLAEAVLSYVGVGVDPGTISYGVMINNARGELAREPMVWWQITTAFVFMVMLVLAANLFADAVRDAFDPRGQRFKRRAAQRRLSKEAA